MVVGYYVYVEASYPAKTDDTFNLYSPVISYKGVLCLSFWYHMWGSQMGQLIVYSVQQQSLNELWAMSGEELPSLALGV